VKNENRASLGSRTAAAVVSSRSGPTPLTTRSANVQTDLTWPNGQDRPILVPLLHAKLKHVKHLPFLLQRRAEGWTTLAPLGRVGLIATPLEEQQPHLRIRRRRKQYEPSDVLKTNPLAGVRRRTKGHG